MVYIQLYISELGPRDTQAIKDKLCPCLSWSDNIRLYRGKGELDDKTLIEITLDSLGPHSRLFDAIAKERNGNETRFEIGFSDKPETVI